MGNMQMFTQLPPLTGAAGAAFLLRKPARTSDTLVHPNGVVTVRDGAPYISVELAGPQPDEGLRAEAWRVLQEALDVQAARLREPLAAHFGEREYLTWERASNGYLLTIGETAKQPWSFSAQATTGSGNATPPPAPIRHHPSFRFYRLSRLSEDLHDAYRNAYLALECVVSDVSPRRKKGSTRETEPEWLKRVLGGPLAPGLPGGLEVDATVDELYTRGRNPVFHAKSGEPFTVPQGEDREHLWHRFNLLHTVLAALYRHLYGPGLPGGWGRLSIMATDVMTRAGFHFDGVSFRSGTSRLVRPVQPEVIEQPRRLGHLWARAEVEPPAGFARLDGIDLLLAGEDHSWVEFAEPVPLVGVSGIRIELHTLVHNERAPTPLHST